MPAANPTTVDTIEINRSDLGTLPNNHTALPMNDASPSITSNASGIPVNAAK